MLAGHPVDACGAGGALGPKLACEAKDPGAVDAEDAYWTRIALRPLRPRRAWVAVGTDHWADRTRRSWRPLRSNVRNDLEATPFGEALFAKKER